MCEKADLATHSCCIREHHGEGENGMKCLLPWPEIDEIPSYPNHQCWCVVWGRKMAGSKVGGTPALSSHPLNAELQFARQMMSGFNIFGQISSLFSRLPDALIVTNATGCGHEQERWWDAKQPSHCLMGLRTGQDNPPPSAQGIWFPSPSCESTCQITK